MSSNKTLPTITIDSVKPTIYYDATVTISSDKWYDKICKQARKDIPDDKLFAWWVETALEEMTKCLKEKKKNK